MDPAIKIKSVTVFLGKNFKALKNVNLELNAGKVIGFIGPSGAGKTTLVRGIVGRLYLKSGSINIFGMPAGSPELRSQVSYMTQELSVYSDLTVKENLKYFAVMAGLPRRQIKKAIENVLKVVDMTHRSKNLVSNLSSGQKQRVSLAIALIGSPRLMVLDEPTIGLDPVLRDKLWRLFKFLAERGTTLIVTSHSMDEAKRCDDLVLIRDGEVIAHDSPEEFRRKTGTKSIEQGFLKLVKGKE
jgi:ABC-2 type transport system ATP-binding protein